MTLQFIISENTSLEKNTLITGFHGIGTTGFIAIKYLINQLDAKKLEQF